MLTPQTVSRDCRNSYLTLREPLTRNSVLTFGVSSNICAPLLRIGPLLATCAAFENLLHERGLANASWPAEDVGAIGVAKHGGVDYSASGYGEPRIIVREVLSRH